MSTAQICIMGTIILYLCFVIFTGVMIGRRSKKRPPRASTWAAGASAPWSPP